MAVHRGSRAACRWCRKGGHRGCCLQVTLISRFVVSADSARGRPGGTAHSSACALGPRTAWGLVAIEQLEATWSCRCAADQPVTIISLYEAALADAAAYLLILDTCIGHASAAADPCGGGGASQPAWPPPHDNHIPSMGEASCVMVRVLFLAVRGAVPKPGGRVRAARNAAPPSEGLYPRVTDPARPAEKTCCGTYGTPGAGCADRA